MSSIRSDTQIVDAVIAPFKEKYSINVEYFRGGAADVTSKVLAEWMHAQPIWRCTDLAHL